MFRPAAVMKQFFVATKPQWEPDEKVLKPTLVNQASTGSGKTIGPKRPK
jgi:hypothetical protein